MGTGRYTGAVTFSVTHLDGVPWRSSDRRHARDTVDMLLSARGAEGLRRTSAWYRTHARF